MLQIEFPMIMAPMFLVSNEAMMKSGMHSGIMATFPSLNYRKEGELEQLIMSLNKYKNENKVKGNFGVNLIVQKTNPLYQKHLKVCTENKVPFYITSLGNPKEVILEAHAYGAKVFCDVTNIKHAEKCASLNCDGFIAVGQGAGGHAGPHPLHILIPSLINHFPHIPVIAAGGIASGQAMLSSLAAGAGGFSIGTRFIASHEATVSTDYKNAIVNAGMDNIVMTNRISGTPCSIINTPYAQKIGYNQSWFEKLLSKSSTVKKYFKMMVQVKGMKKLEDSIKPGNYHTLWCAGKSVEMIDKILGCEEIIANLKDEFKQSVTQLKSNLQSID
ncbi:MAG: nitronate monooxygenase [Bacteroidia bacterium]|nr:nitronate monooxygenase [Bacteroidia bacterium]